MITINNQLTNTTDVVQMHESQLSCVPWLLEAGLAPCLIQSTLADVADPLDNIVVTIVQFGLKHFQISHFESRASKRDLIKEE